MRCHMPNEILIAAQAGDVEKLRQLLAEQKNSDSKDEKNQNDINGVNAEGQPVLFAVIQKIRDIGVEQSKNLNNPQSVAELQQLKRNYLTIAEMLMANGANVNVSNYRAGMVSEMTVMTNAAYAFTDAGYLKIDNQVEKELLIKLSEAGANPLDLRNQNTNVYKYINNSKYIDEKEKRETLELFKKNDVKHKFGKEHFRTDCLPDMVVNYGQNWVYEELIKNLKANDHLSSVEFEVKECVDTSHLYNIEYKECFNRRQWTEVINTICSHPTVTHLDIYHQNLSYLQGTLQEGLINREKLYKEQKSEEKPIRRIEEVHLHYFTPVSLNAFTSAVAKRTSISALGLHDLRMHEGRKDFDGVIPQSINKTLTGFNQIEKLEIDEIERESLPAILNRLETSDSICDLTLAQHEWRPDNRKGIDAEITILHKMAEYNRIKKEAQAAIWQKIAYPIAVMRAVTGKADAKEAIPEAWMANAVLRKEFIENNLRPHLGQPPVAAGLNGVIKKIKDLLPVELSSEFQIELKGPSGAKYIEFNGPVELRDALCKCLTFKPVMLQKDSFISQPADIKSTVRINHPKMLWSYLSIYEKSYKAELTRSIRTILNDKIQPLLINATHIHLSGLDKLQQKFNSIYENGQISDLLSLQKKLNELYKDESEALKMHLPQITTKDIKEALNHYKTNKGFYNITPDYIEKLAKVTVSKQENPKVKDIPNINLLLAVSRSLLLSKELKGNVDAVDEKSPKNPHYKIRQLYIKLKPLADLLHNLKCVPTNKKVYDMVAENLLTEKGIMAVYKNLPDVNEFSNFLVYLSKNKLLTENNVKLAIDNMHKVGPKTFIEAIGSLKMLSPVVVQNILANSDDLPVIVKAFHINKPKSIPELEKITGDVSYATLINDNYTKLAAHSVLKTKPQVITSDHKTSLTPGKPGAKL